MCKISTRRIKNVHVQRPGSSSSKEKNLQNFDQNEDINGIKIENQKIFEKSSNHVEIKNFRLKLKHQDSLSENKLKQKKTSILSNIYKPVISQIKDEIQFQKIQNLNRMYFLKEKVKKIEIELPSDISTQDSKRQKIHSNAFMRQESKTFRIERKFSNPEATFLFEDQQPQKQQNKRKFSLHFERSKYFKIDSNVVRQPFRSASQRKQNSELVFNQSVVTGKDFKHLLKKSQVLIDDVMPVIKQRNLKPRTAGGFLKKYCLKDVNVPADFQLSACMGELF